MAATNSSPIGASEPVMTINTTDLAPATPQFSKPGDLDDHSIRGSPRPRGTDPAEEADGLARR